MKARNLILIIMDTLRADFESLCSIHGVQAGHFADLRKYAALQPRARCGSFPTGPMRTDLLTGSLAFLRGEWALPRPGEQTLLSRCRDAGFHSCLVTDNYVAVIPRVGGLLVDLFDNVDFIRGAAADPWATPDAALVRSCLESDWIVPTRSPRFEAQFLANSTRLRAHGQSHVIQVFKSATEQLHALEKHERYVLWVDSFACHEPWVSAEELPVNGDRPALPFFPAYESNRRFPEEYLSNLRNQYARRIGETSDAMGEFVEAVAPAMSSGDTALMVLSDHGFLFGEYGFVGKPAETPLPPQLHDLVCWLSPHFEEHLPPSTLGVQPHILHDSVLSLLGLSRPNLNESELHIFGRNSPRSDFLAAADLEGLTVLQKGRGVKKPLSWIPWELLDASIPLVEHRNNCPSTSTLNAVRSYIRKGLSDWLDGFNKLL